MTAPDVEPSLRLLLVDFDYLQRAIDKLDSQRFQVKNWCITSVGALLAVAFGGKLPLVASVAVITTLFFAFLEVYYVATLADVIARSVDIERLINLVSSGHDATSQAYVFGISQAFRQPIRFKEIPRLIFSKGRIHVTAFYFGLLLVALTSMIVGFLI